MSNSTKYPNVSIWGRAGTQFDGVMTVESALEKAGLNWTVGQEPLYIPDFDGRGPAEGLQYTYVPGYFANVRSDTRDVLGVVGERYNVVQNEEGFRLLEPLLDKGVVELIGGGSFRGGRDVWIQARFDLTGTAADWSAREGISPMVLFSNGHGGDRGVGLMETPIRVWCQNTFITAIRGATRVIRLVHTISVGERLVEAAETLWGDLIHRYTQTAKQYTALREKRITEREFKRAVLDVIAPVPVLEDPATDDGRKLRMVERANERRQAITQAWHSGIGHTGDSSAFEAFSGLVEVLDHNDDLYPIRSGSKAEQSALGGTLAVRKQRVLSALMAL